MRHLVELAIAFDPRLDGLLITTQLGAQGFDILPCRHALNFLLDLADLQLQVANLAAELSGALGLALAAAHDRSEEHTSELQSLMRISYAVFCLKKKNTTKLDKPNTHSH